MNKKIAAFLIIAFCLTQSGCALVQVPLKVAGAAFNLVKTVTASAINLAAKMPKPPPWVFF